MAALQSRTEAGQGDSEKQREWTTSASQFALFPRLPKQLQLGQATLSKPLHSVALLPSTQDSVQPGGVRNLSRSRPVRASVDEDRAQFVVDGTDSEWQLARKVPTNREGLPLCVCVCIYIYIHTYICINMWHIHMLVRTCMCACVVLGVFAQANCCVDLFR